MKYITIFAISILSVSMLCSCGKGDETPPLSRERTQLIIRLFDSMEKNDKSSILSRAEKLKKLAPDNLYINHIIEVQTANTYLVHAQKALDEGHETLALQILEKGIQKHPLNRTLQNEYKNLQILIDTEKAVNQGKFENIPDNLKQVPTYGPQLVKKIKNLKK